jgi:hypothetical protein
MKRSAAWLCSASLLATTFVAVPAAAMKADAGADEVRAWNEITISTLVSGKVPVPEQPLYLTYVHRAVYTAVLRSTQKHASTAAAALGAAHDVLVADFVAQKESLDAAYAEALADIPDSRARRVGLIIGTSAASALVRERADDGRNGTVLPVPAPGPGVWIPTPPNTIGTSSWLGSVRPFTLRSADQFRPGAPPPLTSKTWARDYNETRILGSATSTARTPAQTEVARFWADPPYVQNQRALRAFTAAHRYNALRTAELFALGDTAAADALIACWDTKYHYNFWRPFSAIPAGDTDGNPATPSDPSWQPLIVTPNFPEYASAHACATTALATVVAVLTSGNDNDLDLDIDSVTTGTTHHFSSVKQLVSEVANARVWGGLHWRFSTRAGERIGASVARVVLAHRRFAG